MSMKDSMRRSVAARDERRYVHGGEEQRFHMRHERLRLMERRRRDALRAGADQEYDDLGDDFGEELDDE